MNIAICDDQAIFVESLYNELVSCNQADMLISKFTNGMDLLNSHMLTPFDAVFLDIQMPNMNGFEVAQEITSFNKDTYVIFITGYDYLVFDAVKLRPFNFIRKEKMEEEVYETMTALAKVIENKRLRNKVYEFRIKKEIIFIKPSNIIYFKSNKNYVTVFTDDTSFSIREKISYVEQEFKKYDFIRIHKSYIVNPEYIERFNSNYIALKTSDRLPYSNANQKRIIANYMKYLIK